MTPTPFAVFSPALAAGAALAAVGVPLLVHLLFRKRYQIVPWAAVRFLVVAERRHKRRIDQWLLLATRALALLLILFAMVATSPWAEDLWQRIRPGNPETRTEVPRTHHVLVIDASLSMSARADGEQTRFQKAIGQARALVEAGRPGDGYSVFALAGGLQPVIPEPSNEPQKVLDELAKIRPTHGTADHAAALATLADLLARSPRAYPRRQLSFFTDVQRTSWAAAAPRPDGGTADTWQRLTARADVAVVDTAGRDAENLAVAAMAIADPIPLVDQPVTVTVTVANLGRAEQKGARLELLVGRPSAGGTLVALASKDLPPLPPGERLDVTFQLDDQQRFRDRGVHVLKAQLLGGGDLDVDDARALAVDVRDGLRTVLVDGRAAPNPLDRPATLLGRALFPPEATYTLTPNRPQVVTPAEFLDPTVCDLSAIDCVFLCDLPNPTPELADKLDGLLRRGGTVVVGLGPSAAAARARYNAALHQNGAGLLPGAVGEAVLKGPDDPGFRLFADEDEYRRPPLLLLGAPRLRAELINEPFGGYVKLDAPAAGRARRILSFVRPGAGATVQPDPALVEWPRHRGRVFAFTSSFSKDWHAWPTVQTYLVFWNEFLKYAAANPDRHTLRLGEPIEEFFPAAAAGLTAALDGPGGRTAEIPLALRDEGGVARYTDTALSGLYRLGLGDARDRAFAVNLPEVAAGAPTESDLARLDPREFRTVPALQFVTDAADVRPSPESGAVVVTAPRPHGPWLARLAALVAVLVLLAELVIAWRNGPSRAAGAAPPVTHKAAGRLLALGAAAVPLGLAAALLFAVAHAERTGNPLGFLPAGPRAAVERAAGVPSAEPGERTRWRVDGAAALFRNPATDRRTLAALAAAALALTAGVYLAERRAAGGPGRVLAPALLRSAALLTLLFVVLPQLKLAFDREGMPEVVILLDTSQSMDKADEWRDPAVRAKAEELAGPTGLGTAHRLRLAQLLLTRPDAGWLDRLLREKRVKVRVYAVDSKSDQKAAARAVTSVDDPDQIDAARRAVGALEPTGPSSHLGDGVGEVLKTYRGRSPAAVIMFTDGITTAGDDLPKAAKAAAQDGVPLFLVGTGDPWQPPDLALTDVQADDTVGRGDQLVIKARLVATGDVPDAPVTVTLREKLSDGRFEDRGRVTAAPRPGGGPVEVEFTHTPTETGEKTYVLAVPTVPNEVNARNNEVQKTVLVTDARRIRVLYVEGYPRYDFRFVKVLLERESEKSLGGRAVEVRVILLDASNGWPRTDRSAFPADSAREFPTRSQLFEFDVVILGDVVVPSDTDPRGVVVPLPPAALRNLADFVQKKGGGLLFLCGEHGTPAAFTDTPLADVLPVIPGPPPAARAPEAAPVTEGFRPAWTDHGRQHPLFLLSPDAGASAATWGRLPELYWYARNYRPKPLARVLATHPTARAEGGAAGDKHPLIVQQFAADGAAAGKGGAGDQPGPVLFFGFDDTWRWRLRGDEENFDRFWLQTIRVLARSRVRRPEVRVAPGTEFRRDEKVTVQVRFPVESPAPAGPVRVQMTRSPLLRPDGTPGPGTTDTGTLTLRRVPGPTVLFEATLNRAAEGEYRFELTDPETPVGARPSASARVLPPLDERARTELNRADLAAAAAASGGRFYTLATAEELLDDLPPLRRVSLGEAAPPVPVWNHPLLYLLLVTILLGEWLLRKRERLL